MTKANRATYSKEAIAKMLEQTKDLSAAKASKTLKVSVGTVYNWRTKSANKGSKKLAKKGTKVVVTKGANKRLTAILKSIQSNVIKLEKAIQKGA